MSAHPDSAFPKGYPFVCMQSFTPSESGRQEIKLVTGQFGKVMNVHEKWAFVKLVSATSSTEAGWVPLWAIQIGRARRCGDIKGVLNYKLPVQLPGINVRSGTDVLSITIDSLVRSIKQLGSKGTLQFLGDKFERDTNTETGMNNIIVDIVNGVKTAGLFQELNKPDFDIYGLVNNGTKISLTGKPPSWMGNSNLIYARIYRNFYKMVDGKKIDDPYKKPAIYIGQSVNALQRHRTHQSAINRDDPGHHYATARLAKECAMIVICRGIHSASLDIAEQVFMLLLQTYQPSVLKFQLEDAGLTNEQNILERSAKMINMNEHATLLTRCANEVFKSTRWPGGVERESFRASNGLNMSSPLAEVARIKRQPWARIEIPGAMTLYHGPAFSALYSTGSVIACFRLIYGGRELSFHLKNQPGVYPEPGQKVYTIVEMTHDGSPHHLAWAGNLPTVGPMEDWDLARSFAVRLEWEMKDGTGWRSVYSRRDFKSFVDHDAVGSFKAYADAIALLRYLKREEINNRPSWVSTFGLASVRDIKFDHMKQEVHITALHQTTKVDPPQLRSQQAIMDELESLGINISGSANTGPSRYPWRSWLTKNQLGGPPRRTCDTHYVIRYGDISNVNKDYKSCTTEVGGQCKLNMMMNRWNTYSDSHLLRYAVWAPPAESRTPLQQQAFEESLALQKALWFPIVVPTSIVVVEDPKLVGDADHDDDEKGTRGRQAKSTRLSMTEEFGWITEGGVSAWNSTIQSLLNSTSFMTRLKATSQSLIHQEVAPYKEVTKAIVELLVSVEGDKISKTRQKAVFTAFANLPSGNPGRELSQGAKTLHTGYEPLMFLEKTKLAGVMSDLRTGHISEVCVFQPFVAKCANQVSDVLQVWTAQNC